MRGVLNPGATLVPIGLDFMEHHEVSHWTDMPMFLPVENLGMVTSSNARALEAGLTVRSLEETLRDTLNWRESLTDQPPVTGLTSERHAELLAHWKQR
jgi:hypothetical protein